MEGENNVITCTGEDDSCSSDCDLAFASVDFSGVNFDADEFENKALLECEDTALGWERRFAFGDYDTSYSPSKDEMIDETDFPLKKVKYLGYLLSTGKYSDILELSETAQEFFSGIHPTIPQSDNTTSLHHILRNRILDVGDDNCSVIGLLELEILGIAALNLFLQSNYTGPSLHHSDDTATEEATKAPLDGIDPHPCFVHLVNDKLKFSDNDLSKFDSSSQEEKKDNCPTTKRHVSYQNSILSELAVDGQWPCQVCYSPYFLLLARSIFLTLADPLRLQWSHPHGMHQMATDSVSEIKDWRIPSNEFVAKASKLQGVCLWNGRATVAHERLIQSREPSTTLWNEAESMFRKCISFFCSGNGTQSASEHNHQAARVMLEWGLAEHHFDRPGKGRSSFNNAVQYTGLEFEVTGAIGKRTKFQSKATAQMLVKAKSAIDPDQKILSAEECRKSGEIENPFQNQMIEHSEEEILLEKIKFDDDKENEIQRLSTLDQCILLALCLDVKNSNPSDGLTNEEMAAYLARVLDHHDDWMIYSTALLERSWVEFDRLHARERAILQIQALVDQHTNSLTITQSTRKSIEESAPVQDRIRNLHNIVYPPRWLMIEDLADRYAGMGIVTSAAELFLEIQLWDYVVECYKRAGRVAQAEKIVRERLAVEETPRMWNALGDLTNDPTHYEKAIELSKGRFSNSYLSLGSYYFEKGELEKAAENYMKAVRVRPLVPEAWFRLGAISMQLSRWDDALRAFSEVVMQEPEDAEAWANVAAVHMHNKHPAEAYPALVESLKCRRSNWRVWLSKLYTCLDLNKYDEAIQACNVLLDLRKENKTKDGIPALEEKCVRGIVGGTIKLFIESRNDKVALDSARRSLTRVHALLERISSSSDAEPWVFETMSYFHNQTGNMKDLMDDLMKEYRALQAIPGWEKDDHLVLKIRQVVSQMVNIYQQDETKDNLNKSRFLILGVIQKIEIARGGVDGNKLPEDVDKLQKMLSEADDKLSKLSM